MPPHHHHHGPVGLGESQSGPRPDFVEHPSSDQTPRPPPDPAHVRVFRHADGRLRLTIADDRSYLHVGVVRAAPLTHGERFVSLTDGRGEELCLLSDLAELEPESRAVVVEELRRRYLTATIERIVSVRSEFHVIYWDVETDRGPRELVMEDNVNQFRWLTDDRVLILDVDNNRFEIPDCRLLDPASRRLLASVT